MLNIRDLTGARPVASVIRIVPLAATGLDRRTFLRGAAFTLAAVAAPAGAFETYWTGGEDMPHGLVTDPLVFVAIDPDGTVTLVAHRAEMGTGSRTSLPMVLADEMGADWARVKIVQAPGDETRYGNQDTDGSRSMRHHIQSMRQMGAAVRTMLARAAAERWQVEPSAVTVEVHEVVSPTGERLGFGELAEAAMALPVPPFEELAFRDEAEFRYIGKGNVPITDLHDITVGKAVYGADVSRPGMKFAAVARPPVVGGKATSYDATAALAVPGVEQVVELQGAPAPMIFAPLGGIAVVATNTWAALEGVGLLEIEWEAGPNGSYDSAAFRAEMEKTAGAPARVIRNQGDWDAAKAAAARTIERTYTQAHMAHATDGAAGGAGRGDGRGRRGLGAGAEPLRHPPGRRRRPRARGGRGHRAPDAARRRLRPQVEVRLRRRGGADLQGGRRARPRAVEP